MEDIDAKSELRDVKNSVLEIRMDANLPNSRSHIAYWPLVVWFKPLLNPMKLVTGQLARIWWERPEVTAGRPEPKQRLVGHSRICNY